MYNAACVCVCVVGETIEEALRREVAEEVGLELESWRVSGSQHWPFPQSSFMVACHATVTPGNTEVSLVSHGSLSLTVSLFPSPSFCLLFLCCSLSFFLSAQRVFQLCTMCVCVCTYMDHTSDVYGPGVYGPQGTREGMLVF